MGAATEMQVWELPADRVALTSAPRRLRREVGGRRTRWGERKAEGSDVTVCTKQACTYPSYTFRKRAQSHTCLKRWSETAARVSDSNACL